MKGRARVIIEYNLRNYAKLIFESCKKSRHPTIFCLQKSVWESKRSAANRIIPVLRPERSESATWQTKCRVFLSIKGKKKARSAIFYFFVLKIKPDFVTKKLRRTYGVLRSFCPREFRPREDFSS